jgi:hypothetical protein
MLGIVAWIRPDGRKALVVVAGSDQMASGDPGVSGSGGLMVGDLVFMPDVSKDMTSFRTGLSLVSTGFWPQIVRDIGVMAKDQVGAEPTSNVVELFRERPSKPATSAAIQYRMLAAE